MRFYPTILTFPSFDGSLEDYVMSTRWGDDMVHLRPSPIPTALMPMTNFIRFGKGEDGLGILVPLKERRSLALVISELVLAGPFDFTTWLLPGESRRLPMILFVNPPDADSLEKIQKVLETAFK